MAAKAAILKINSRHRFPNLWSIWTETCSVATGQHLDRNELKSCPSEIQDGRYSRHLENLFWTSSQKPQGELSWDLHCSNRLMCRWKKAKIMPIENPKWPRKLPYWKPIFDLLPNHWAIWVGTHCSNRMISRSKIDCADRKSKMATTTF